MSFSQLDRPVQFLKGVGPRRAEALARMGILTARDLLYHTPRRYDDASTVQTIGSLEVGAEATAVGRVRTKGTLPTRKGLRIFQAVLEDDTGMITCAWPGQPWLDRKIRPGDTLLVTGPVKFFHGRQIQPREFTVLSRAEDDTSVGERGTIFVAYPASEHVPQWVLRGIFEKNLEPLLNWSADEEFLPGPVVESLGLPSLRVAFESLHRPESLAGAEAGRRRLAFDELFFLQVAQARVRHQLTRARPGIGFDRTNELIRPLHDSLGFELTGAQTRVLREVFADMTAGHRMSRMLQGDVGSGKTVIAVFAMLLAVEGGYQTALMAPTEILAEQHAENLTAMLEPLGVSVGLLTASVSSSERAAVLATLSDGSLSVVVGTHALIQDAVDFARLGLVVVDEQHRFGVRQRMALGEQDTNPDILIMSATPIPRTMAMALYGDLDLSILDELPPGRKPVRTRLRYPNKRDETWRFVESQLAAGRQAYVVYPLVDESDKLDLRSATEEHRELSERVFSEYRIGLVHGQLSSDEKSAIMTGFKNGEIDLLVATSVIEVGIDVANATVMVIEHAERFGLSQLHQLRGRVGRGADESYCILIAEPGELARERLEIFTKTHDGFEIARADLMIRGQGDLFGAQQHGRDPFLRHADLLVDGDLLREAQRMAREVVDSDPELEHAAHVRMRELFDTRYSERLKLHEVG